MKEIKVLIKDKNTLVLLEDAFSGDYINLSSLNTVDYILSKSNWKRKIGIYY